MARTYFCLADKLIAQWDRQERQKATKRRGALRQAARRAEKAYLATGVYKIPKILQPPPPPPPTTVERQGKLVSALFNGATLRRAWLLAGYRASHHVSIDQVLASPAILELIRQGFARGGRLRANVERRALDKLGYVIVNNRPQPIDPLDAELRELAMVYGQFDQPEMSR